MSNIRFDSYPSMGEDAHTDEHAFCTDMTCPCHEDSEAINTVGDYVENGLMTNSEADQYYHGRTV